jgi:hypothetical protein
MSRVAEENFIGSHADPLLTKTSCQIASKPRGQPLRDDEPNTGGNSKFGQRRGRRRPRRDCNVAKRRSKGNENDGDADSAKSSGADRPQ